jgi:hypothetical protein
LVDLQADELGARCARASIGCEPAAAFDHPSRSPPRPSSGAGSNSLWPRRHSRLIGDDTIDVRERIAWPGSRGGNSVWP